MYHTNYYARAYYSEATVFAVTQKGTYYQILSLGCYSREREDELYSASSQYAGHCAWYSVDDRETITSHERYVIIKEEQLQTYLRGGYVEEMEYLLRFYEFDSKIVEFLIVESLDGYVDSCEGLEMTMTRVNRKESVRMQLSALTEAPTITLPELNWEGDVEMLAGWCIQQDDGRHWLISLENRYLSKDGFARTAYSRGQQKEDEVRVAIMSSKEYEAHSYGWRTIHRKEDMPQWEILPQLGLLVWERENDGVRLKTAPKYYFVDLTKAENIDVTNCEDDDSESVFDEGVDGSSDDELPF